MIGGFLVNNDFLYLLPGPDILKVNVIVIGF